ncbi:uncharacterized protein [Zea mays]|uniref:uncharacterized protein n=1 Tax=Zea mays TaxID=4577 RepID=UPI0009AA9B95|nr:uncharacterized protein LOC103637468 [Zea mays]|eukprot:XP_020398796.1 uncharacterized protein LOC103637468 [Zea mays]
MDPFKNNDVRPPLRELSNNTLEDECPDVSISNASIIDCTIPCDTTPGGRDDARQRRRERERVRYATMSAEKKNELKKRRESRKKGNVMHHEYLEVCNIPANKDNSIHQNNEIEDVDDDSYRLHKNNSFEVHRRLGSEKLSTHLSDECPQVFVSDRSIKNPTVHCDNTLGNYIYLLCYVI